MSEILNTRFAPATSAGWDPEQWAKEAAAIPELRTGCDGDGFSLETADGQVVAYLGLDLTGEGDCEEWNRAQRVRAEFYRQAPARLQALAQGVVFLVKQVGEECVKGVNAEAELANALERERALRQAVEYGLGCIRHTLNSYDVAPENFQKLEERREQMQVALSFDGKPLEPEAPPPVTPEVERLRKVLVLAAIPLEVMRSTEVFRGGLCNLPDLAAQIDNAVLAIRTEAVTWPAPDAATRERVAEALAQYQARWEQEPSEDIVDIPGRTIYHGPDGPKDLPWG